MILFHLCFSQKNTDLENWVLNCEYQKNTCLSLLDTFGTVTEIGSTEWEEGKQETPGENAAGNSTEAVVAALSCCWRKPAGEGLPE